MAARVVSGQTAQVSAWARSRCSYSAFGCTALGHTGRSAGDCTANLPLGRHAVDWNPLTWLSGISELSQSY